MVSTGHGTFCKIELKFGHLKFIEYKYTIPTFYTIQFSTKLRSYDPIQKFMSTLSEQ